MKLFKLPADFSALSDEELAAAIAEDVATAQKIGDNPDEFLSDEVSLEQLTEEMTSGVANVEAAKAELAKRGGGKRSDDDEQDVDDDEEDMAAAAASRERLASLAKQAGELSSAEDEGAADGDGDDAGDGDGSDGDGDGAADGDGGVTASAGVTERAPSGAAMRTVRPRLSRSRRSTPAPQEERVALTAAAEGLGYALGSEIADPMAIAEMMLRRRYQFGTIPEGTHGERIPIVRAEWGDMYDAERRLSQDDPGSNWERIQAATKESIIAGQFAKRLAEAESEGALVASGGLCAPVTPYYNLQMLSVADRPVRAALPAFNAQRGGIKYARPATLAAVGDAVGVKTVAEDAAGGSEATKTCQFIPCPTFYETDIEAVYHCITFGNIPSRTFPELLTQWNGLVLAAHARAAETVLLNAIDSSSTAVHADDQGLGSSAVLPVQIITAANGMRSRHRMNPETVLRVLLPFWVLDLLVSDVYRSQFQRFEMTGEQFVALLRSHNIEPSFYLDSATGANQIFVPQHATSLEPFPPTIRWYLFPEGAHLYVDGGVLELGLVRDSLLNRTNDFQIFGESFENAAFVGIESIAVTTTTCPTGAVSAPITVTSCGY